MDAGSNVHRILLPDEGHRKVLVAQPVVWRVRMTGEYIFAP